MSTRFYVKDSPSVDITPEGHQPMTWDGIAGNEDVKDYFYNCIRATRLNGEKSGFNMLLTGGSREGKTSTISLGVRALLCCNLDFQTMNPCQRCTNCCENFNIHGTGEWHGLVEWGDPDKNRTPVQTHYIPLDCTTLTESEIDDLKLRIRMDDGHLKIVYLDEVHRLARRHLDERLLKPIESYRVIWIASSAAIKRDGVGDTGRLDKMFQNRFSYRLQTQKPSKERMLHWLADRCQEYQISLDSNGRKTLHLLVERSNRIPGMALHVINKAYHGAAKKLTLEMVEKHIFDLDD